MQWTLFIHYYFEFDYLSYRLDNIEGKKNKFERKSIYHDQNVGKIKWSKTSASQTHSAVKRGVHLIGGFQESLCRNSGKFTANAHDIFTKSHPFWCIVKVSLRIIYYFLKFQQYLFPLKNLKLLALKYM